MCIENNVGVRVTDVTNVTLLCRLRQRRAIKKHNISVSCASHPPTEPEVTEKLSRHFVAALTDDRQVAREKTIRHSVAQAHAADLAGWTERFGRTPRTVREIINAANEDDSPLADVIQDIAGEGRGVNAKRLGWWLRRQVGRIVDGMKLTQERVSRVANWKVIPVNSQ
jgi:hypothetical protein